ncbi:AAEL013647-PA [Aedes aegypti]|uniref:AAEL013647-PA n=1 Tax=Aedes aegypti TaxID=7159 RepID=Q16II9_AEDAE|nr:AAEL013647-PA [Aedes aegypti]
MKLLHTCAEESSVHGLAHLVAQNRHWAEKLLWAVILIFSIYFSYGVCLTTWTRYQESPTVLTLETDYRRWMYRRPAATVCPMRVDQTQLHQMIRKIWNIDEKDDKYQYYSQYLETITNATYQNLNTFEPFKDDRSLANIDMLEVARNVKYEFIPSSEFSPVVTEMGVCFSSSNLSYIQKVSDFTDYTNRTWSDSCYSFDLCKSGIKRNAYGKMKIFMYVHSEDEVMMASNVIQIEMKDSEQIELILWVDQIVSSANLKHLTPARRKCVYPYETTSYYKQRGSGTMVMMATCKWHLHNTHAGTASIFNCNGDF